MLAEEMRNLARMARTMRTMLDRMIEVADDLAEDAAQFERTAGPAKPQQIATLPANVMDLRDPSLWRAN